MITVLPCTTDIVFRFDGSTDNANTYTTVTVGAAVAIDLLTNDVCAEEYILLPDGTNNLAEYLGLMSAINLAHRLDIKDPTFEGDSKLVVGQVFGINGKKWKVNNLILKNWNNHIQSLLKMYFSSYTLTWIPRENNQEAGTRAYAKLQEYSKDSLFKFS